MIQQTLECHHAVCSVQNLLSECLCKLVALNEAKRYSYSLVPLGLVFAILIKLSQH